MRNRTHTARFGTGNIPVGVFLCLSLAFVLVASSAPARAQLPPAGSVISSRSLAIYDLGEARLSILSNEVNLSVLPVYGPVLLPDGTVSSPASEAAAFGGETVSFPYTLTNTGNTEDSFYLRTAAVQPSDFIPLDAEVYLDIDGDGAIDPGETPVPEQLTLTSGETAALVLSTALPVGLGGGETAHLDLRAVSGADTTLIDSGNIVRISARNEASVSMEIRADASVVMPGERVTYTVDFGNSGDRDAAGVVISCLIDSLGMVTGTEYIPGSALSTAGGTIQYLRGDSGEWIEVEPPAGRVRGVRLLAGTMQARETGFLSFGVLVDGDCLSGEITEIAGAGWTDGEGVGRAAYSNEVLVLVGRVSDVFMGPAGYPDAPDGTDMDRVLLMIEGDSETAVFSHEILNDGNFADTFVVALADSSLVPAGWTVTFAGPGGLLAPVSPFSAMVGPVEADGRRSVDMVLETPAGSLREFPGRELALEVEARSTVDGGSSDRVTDVMVKSDMPVLSIEQSIREPNAMVGDILSFLVTIENLTEDTVMDSILLVESLPPGLSFSGGSDTPAIDGNRLEWQLGALGPGEKRSVVMRATVEAGQETGELVGAAWVYGVSALGERAVEGPAYASVRLVEGEFTRKGMVFGSVFIDGDGDGKRGIGERGVPGARVFCENGTFSAADSTGMWSIPGLNEGRHVIRIDPRSVPDGSRPVTATYFGLGVPGQYLIDLAPSGNRRVDIPLREASVPAEGEAFAALEGDVTAVTREDREDTSAVRAGAGDAPAGNDADGSAADKYAGAFDAMTLPSTLFAGGSDMMEEIPLREVAALSLWLRENPGWKISIEGHTDSIPIMTAEFPSNFELSLARARSVFQLLRMNGIPEERMDYTGYGSRRPVAGNSTAGERALNRRVDIRAVPPEGYTGGDPDIPGMLSRPDPAAVKLVLADSAGVCAEIVKPGEGHVFRDRDGIEVEVLAPLASSVELYVNNVPVGREKIGRKQIDLGEGTIGFIFYGVRLDVGANDILVVCRNSGERNVCVRRVYLAGRPSVITSERKIVEVPADGSSRPGLTFLVSDEAGLPVRDGLFLTVTGPADLLAGIDKNPDREGTQVITSGGRAVIELPPSDDTRRERVDIRLGDLAAGCSVEYSSPMRDWFLFGYGEGSLGYSSITGGGWGRRTRQRIHDGGFAEGKISFYGQGEVSDGHLMTVAVDTRPVLEDRLGDRIEPDRFYPVYGDASDLRFNASARGGTYARLEHHSYEVMAGDYETKLGGMELTRYERKFSGMRGTARSGRVSATGFVTYTDQVTFQEEIRADGTSGFYFLDNYPLIENSENIRIEVRDRFRPENIVRVDYKNWGRDYDINYMDGSILFKEPVRAFDEDLNPVTIVVSYECRIDGEKNFIYGLRPVFGITDSLSLGVTAVLEEEGGGDSSLLGLDLSGHLWKDLSIEGEYAHSEKFAIGPGDALRIRLIGRHGDFLKWNAYYRDIDERFFNPSFSGGKTELGSRKTGADLDWRVAAGWTVRSKAYRHDFAERDEEKGYFEAVGAYESGDLEGRTGLAAASHSDTREGDHSALLLLAGLGLRKWDVRGDIEIDQIVAGEEVQEYPDRIQAKLARKVWRWIDGTLTYEYRTGRRTGTRHLTQIGLESDTGEDLRVYSRYRMEGAMSGERALATIGISDRFRLGEGLTSTFSAEKAATVSGSALDDFTSFASGWLYTPSGADYKLKGDYELRLETARRKHLLTAAALKKFSATWAGLLKGEAWYSEEKTDSDRAKGSMTAGFSFRPAAGPLTLLSLVRGNYEKNSPAHPGAVDKSLTLMSEANWSSGSWEIEGKAAARWIRNDFRGYVASASSFLYHAQLTRILGESWDAGLAVRTVHQRETGTVRYGGGVEIGRIMAENLRLEAGYDFGGHSDSDTEMNEFTASGFHVGLELKFDERLLEYFHGRD